MNPDETSVPEVATEAVPEIQPEEPSATPEGESAPTEVVG